MMQQSRQCCRMVILKSCMVDGVVEKLVNDDSPTTNQGDLSYFEVITGKQPTSLKAWLAKAGAAFQ